MFNSERKLLEKLARPQILIWLSVILFLVFNVLTIYFTKGVVNDDSYITYRYAKNLFKFHQFTYNLGYPTYSVTTPLWVFFLASFGAITQNFVFLSQLLAIFLALPSAFLLFKLSQKIVGDFAYLVPVFFLLDPYLIGATYCGTEMALFSLLSVLLVYWIFFFENFLLKKIISGLIFAFLVLARPEGFVFFALLFFYLLFLHNFQRVKELLVVFIFGLLFLTPWFLFCFFTFKTIIPTSIILKSLDAKGRMPFSDLMTMKQLLILLIKGYFPYFLIILGAGILFVIKKFKKSFFNLTKNDEYKFLPSLIVTGLLIFYFAGLKEKLISSRYFITFSPYLAMATVQALKYLKNNFLKNLKTSYLVFLVIFLMIFLNSFAVFSRTKRAEEADIPRVKAGEFIAQNLPKTAVIASLAGAGGLGYFFEGLVWDYELISVVGSDLNFAKRVRMGPKIEPEEYFYKNPDYFVVHLSNKNFDKYGEVIYENSFCKVIKIEKSKRDTCHSREVENLNFLLK